MRAMAHDQLARERTRWLHEDHDGFETA